MTSEQLIDNEVDKQFKNSKVYLLSKRLGNKFTNQIYQLKNTGNFTDYRSGFTTI